MSDQLRAEVLENSTSSGVVEVVFFDGDHELARAVCLSFGSEQHFYELRICSSLSEVRLKYLLGRNTDPYELGAS